MEYTYKSKGDSKNIVLILHGAGNSNTFINISKDLDPKYKYIALSIPGHDNVPLGDVKEIDNLSEYVRGFLHTQNYSSCSVIGFSLGGLIATVLYSKYQKELKLNKLVCWAVPFAGWNFQIVLIYLSVTFGSIFFIKLPKFLLSFFRLLGYKFTNNDQNLLCAINLRDLKRILEIIKKRKTIPIDDENILYIYDEKDRLADVRNLKMLSTFKQAKAINNPYGGHFGKKEYWDRSLSIIKSFIH